MTISLTGINSIDALLDGDSWTGTVRQAATINYTYGGFVGGNRDLAALSNPATIGQAYINAAQSAMQLWENVANVTFAYHAGSNQSLMLGYTDDDLNPNTDAGITITYPSSPVSKFGKVDVEISPTNILSVDFAPGQYGFMTMIHELGHALGFKHPFDVSDQVTNFTLLPASQDSLNNTVMSYTEGSIATDNNPPQTPMIYDIQAMQYLYGANHSYHSGNDVYSYNGAPYVGTIWDGGGTDAIFSTAYSGNVTIDLREGIDNISTIGRTSLWIAYGANIENATTGSGNDTVTGNPLANSITTAQGDDNINGAQGNDTIQGGDGNDQIHGGQGDDNIKGNKGNDVLWGDLGNNTIHGGQGDDTISGGPGNNLLSGDLGNDLIFVAGAGHDTIAFAPSNGNDTIGDFNSVLDHLQFSHLQFASVSAVEAAITYQQNSTAILRIDATDSVTIIGLNGTLPTTDITII